ncbi:cellulase family glycosylhydrolase [Mycobacterium hodleri]|uniref:glycoside hydrolase family 5 protein n=1 Tax=Mycolicibacterium hodleri TaxID=49897 RepID=UPI0021F33884|nr:glycoside hydrolase family 5 protein [Mycolicibacterium hodleri]MCV7133938.1 cellulase family glycosylhydrolase [Mycolicibacterium hodleri]
MTGSIGGWSGRVATRGIIAAVPTAMVLAYSGNLFVQIPPRSASYSYVETAEIVDAPSTVGIADSNLYGMTDAEISTELDRLQSLGVTSIRVFVPWGLVEYADDTYNWSYLDGIINAAEERDMGVMMEVNATPSWAAADPESANYPAGSATPDVEKFTDFMGTLATRYGDTVSAYEIWNEPNYASFSNPIDPAAYAELLKSVYPVLKEIDPTATVVAGALGTVQDSSVTMSAVTFVQQMLEAGAGDYFDAISVHPYQDTLPFSDGYDCNCGGQLTPLQEIDAIKALIGTDKTVWITEYGLSTVNGADDEAKQAQYIQDLLDYWQTYSQAGPIFIYTGSDTATGSSDPEANYGLFYENGDLKQAAEMLAAWIAEHTTVTTPTDPGSTTQPTLQETLQSIVNAVSETIRQAVQSISVFAQAIVTAITNVVTNLTNALASIGGAATVSAAEVTTSTTTATATATETSASTKAETPEPRAESATSSTKDDAAQTAVAVTAATADAVASSSKVVDAAVDSSTTVTPAASGTAASAPVDAEATPKAPTQGSVSETGTTRTDDSPRSATSAGPKTSEAATDHPARRRPPTHPTRPTVDQSEVAKTIQSKTDVATRWKDRHLAGVTSPSSSSSDGGASGGGD